MLTLSQCLQVFKEIRCAVHRWATPFSNLNLVTGLVWSSLCCLSLDILSCTLKLCSALSASGLSSQSSLWPALLLSQLCPDLVDHSLFCHLLSGWPSQVPTCPMIPCPPPLLYLNSQGTVTCYIICVALCGLYCLSSINQKETSTEPPCGCGCWFLVSMECSCPGREEVAVHMFWIQGEAYLHGFRWTLL